MRRLRLSDLVEIRALMGRAPGGEWELVLWLPSLRESWVAR